MKNIVIALAVFIFALPYYSQVNGNSVKEIRDAQRHLGIRQGEELEYCGTHWKRMELIEKHPALKELYQKHHNSLEEKFKSFQEDRSSNVAAERGVVYTIPVVFHVLHQNTAENISFDQIEDAVSILNRDFRLNNTDAGSVNANFIGMPADAEIEFALATIAPNGDCFNGVTRTFTYYTYLGDDGGDQIQAVIDGNDVYNGNWPGDEYLNIYVASDIGGAAGYTTNPGWSGTGMGNGIWIQHGYVGSIGTGSVQRSRSLTHEVGHWLNLSHNWGPNNNPGNASSCSDDDGTKSEGFGRPLLEFATTGKPIIAPHYSGQADFLKKEFICALPGKMTNIHESAANDFLLKEAEWFTPDYGYASKMLVDVLKNHKKWKQLATRQRYFVNSNFTETAIAKRYDEIIEIIEQGTSSIPQQVELKLPKLDLPKLQKV